MFGSVSVRFSSRREEVRQSLPLVKKMQQSSSGPTVTLGISVAFSYFFMTSESSNMPDGALAWLTKTARSLLLLLLRSSGISEVKSLALSSSTMATTESETLRQCETASGLSQALMATATHPSIWQAQKTWFVAMGGDESEGRAALSHACANVMRRKSTRQGRVCYLRRPSQVCFA